MRKRSRTPSNINRLAASIVQDATEEPVAEKNPAVVAPGRLGGLNGGPARAKKLSEKRRKEIAQRAAKARWSEI